jgi:putative tributyrin esterase
MKLPGLLLLLSPLFAMANESTSDSKNVTSLTLHSQALAREVPYTLFLPPGTAPAGGWPLVVILHGDGRHHRSLAEDPAMRELIARQSFAVLCPDGARGWWIDSPLIAGSNYQSMLLELLDEVPSRFPVSAEPKRTVVMGWSMGGFGAVRFAEDHRERVGALATVMALVDFPNPSLPKDQNYGIPPVMADPKRHGDFNCLTKADRLSGLPLLQLAPTNAFDFTMNRNFHARLTELGVGHDYREIPGNHDWATVLAAFPAMFEFANKYFTSAP